MGYRRPMAVGGGRSFGEWQEWEFFPDAKRICVLLDPTDQAKDQ